MSFAVNYDRLKEMVASSIAAFGQPAQIVRNKVIFYDCQAVVTSYEQAEMDGSLITKADRRALVAALNLAIVPAQTDQFAWNDTLYRIVTVQIFNPGAIALVYELQVRGIKTL